LMAVESPPFTLPALMPDGQSRTGPVGRVMWALGSPPPARRPLRARAHTVKVAAKATTAAPAAMPAVVATPRRSLPPAAGGNGADDGDGNGEPLALGLTPGLGLELTLGLTLGLELGLTPALELGLGLGLAAGVK
jgi:hypothetical protein